MTHKKDLQHLHVRVQPITAEKLKSWGEELGYSAGEMIDQIVEGYEDFCNKQDDVIEQTNINDTLKILIEKIDDISKRIK